MNKVILVMVSALMLTACNPTYEENTQNFSLPEGLKDCKIYHLESGITYFNVVRCPNSSTTTQWQAGKMQASATVVEM